LNNLDTEKKLKIIMKAGQGLALTGAAFGLPAWAYARFVEPNWLEVSRPTVKVDELEGIPPAIKGFKVAFFSDLHLPSKGPARNTIWLAVEKTLLERPDLVLLGGDLFDRGKYNPVMADMVRVLTGAGIPVRAVLGNHDYFGRRGEYLRMMKNLEAVGLKWLVNRAEPFCYKGAEIWLAGIDDFVKGEPDVGETARQIPPGVRPLLLLTHNPATIRTVPPHFAHVMLSGHTHGGQINPALPPLNRKLNWITFRPGSHHYSEFPLGWYTFKGIRLYVGRGLGMSGMKLRFNARPELVMLQFV
jgi:predicted MPP superfamily phosphohydrolase